METSKLWYESKIFWLNILTAAVAMLALLADPSSAYVPPEAIKWVILAIGVLNVVLRVFFTSEAIALRRSK